MFETTKCQQKKFRIKIQKKTFVPTSEENRLPNSHTNDAFASKVLKNICEFIK